MSNAESNALALTTWGTSMIDALQGATDAERTEIAKRACEDAITDARSMASLQGSLFEKLLVIERFGLYRTQGCESIQEFLEKAVAPMVQLHRNTLYRLRDAVWEAGRLLEKYGTVKADWSHLSLLAAETRRQLKGGGALEVEEYEAMSRRVAAGEVAKREIEVALQRRSEPARRKRPAVLPGEDPRPSPRRLSPFEELARITAESRRAPARPVVDSGRALELAELLTQELGRVSLVPADAWRLGSTDYGLLVGALEDVVEASTAVIAVAKAGCAA